MTEVIYLWVNEDGKMNGTLPDSFYNLTKLKQLSISGHAFTGEIKTEIGNMVNLTSFKISRNQFTGTLPSELGKCEKLGKGIICGLKLHILFTFMHDLNACLNQNW
jgi:hypothetical protein